MASVSEKCVIGVGTRSVRSIVSALSRDGVWERHRKLFQRIIAQLKLFPLCVYWEAGNSTAGSGVAARGLRGVEALSEEDARGDQSRQTGQRSHVGLCLARLCVQ